MDKICTATTYAARPHYQTFQRHLIFPSDCSIVKGPLPGKHGSGECCAPRWVQRCYIRILIDVRRDENAYL